MEVIELQGLEADGVNEVSDRGFASLFSIVCGNK